ncbi:FAD/NAD(P)-binding domain-containing protein [Dichomitus squalens]|uniref:FAD/NAD(P)-binding domain-containing protein n=1 Tax=Dichomitus squalens TaxID=114155 RepID=A0A4Q9M680_9APHY|nr:FAD/NAD(P)-binding domain-containing protein [Dichomitus squalens]TBU37973.1 FAD/NAD(P)-binding domain-containing protein [Dichomitus squalens]TBU53456.1 FAD/NAD(P)-binding domain-containing protein [Dichomitus squalens]
MTTLKSPSKFRIAIVGAGLGGLLFALFLQKHAEDIEVDIYESAHELTELGAGVAMWPRVWELIKYLGLEEELLEISGSSRAGAPNFVFEKADEAQSVYIHTFPAPAQTFHRADLQKLLAKHLRAYDRIQYAKRLASYTEPASESDPIVLKFRDGTEATCDVLVGCDGIKSAVRRTMYTRMADEAEANGQAEEATRLRAMNDPIWSGCVAYRGLIPAGQLENSDRKEALVPRIVIGKHKNVVIYPISGGEIVNVVAFVETPGGRGTHYSGPWVSTSTTEEVAQQFSGWAPIIRTLVNSWTNPTVWAIHTAAELPTFVKGRVVLLGDAAHAMTPHQGSGAGQAFEDGLILSSLLAHPSVNLKTISRALKIYDDVRRPFAQNIQRVSDLTGSMYHLHEMGWEKVSAEESMAGQYPPELLSAWGQRMSELLVWVSEGDSLKAREQVVSLLESTLA